MIWVARYSHNGRRLPSTCCFDCLAPYGVAHCDGTFNVTFNGAYKRNHLIIISLSAINPTKIKVCYDNNKRRQSNAY